MWPAASQPPAPSNQPREQRQAGGDDGARRAGGTLPGQLDVQARGAEAAAAGAGGGGAESVPLLREAAAAAAAAAAEAARRRRRRRRDRDYAGLPPPPPPPPPPIPLKFIGTLEQGKKKVAIFSDGRGLPLYAAEGELVLGQYRVVRIGVESVVMEYPDGRAGRRSRCAADSRQELRLMMT